MTQIFTRTNDSKKGKRVFNLVLEQDTSNFHFDINKVFVQSFCFNFIFFGGGGGVEVDADADILSVQR